MLTRPAVALAAVLSLSVLAACGNEADNDPESAGEPTASASEETSEPAAETTSCDYPEDAMGAEREVDAPDTDAPAEGTTSATLATNVGDIGLTLDRAAAPCTVNSFVSLVEQGFYDDTPCHRLGNQPGFAILQCGDPSGTGSGGPGYSFADELTGQETYPEGTLAMANAGPDTNGSQFFLVFADSEFPPAYTVFGTIDEPGLEVLRAIAEKGDDGSSSAGGGAPKEPVQIESVTLG